MLYKLNTKKTFIHSNTKREKIVISSLYSRFYRALTSVLLVGPCYHKIHIRCTDEITLLSFPETGILALSIIFTFFTKLTKTKPLHDVSHNSENADLIQTNNQQEAQRKCNMWCQQLDEIERPKHANFRFYSLFQTKKTEWSGSLESIQQKLLERDRNPI